MSEFVTDKWAEYNALELTPVFTPRRYDDKTDRFYWFNKGEEIIPAVGITTMLKRVMPTSPQIIDWQIKYGHDHGTVLNLTAEFGTVMHSCFAEMLIYNRHPSKELIAQGKSLLQALKRYDKSVSESTLEKSIISFQKFRDDYNLRPMLIEASLVAKACTGDYYCMTVDLVCEATNKIKSKVEKQDGFWQRGEKKGLSKMVEETVIEEKTEVWSIDFKSNWQSKDKKSFFDGHKFQLVGAKKAIRQNFNLSVDRVFNWSPLGWKTEVGKYELKEWNIRQEDEDTFELYERLASKLGVFRPSGKIEKYLEWEPGKKAEDMFQTYSYEEFIRNMEKEEVTM